MAPRRSASSTGPACPSADRAARHGCAHHTATSAAAEGRSVSSLQADPRRGGIEQGGEPRADGKGDEQAGNHIVADPIRVAWPAHPSAPDAWGREYAMFPATSPLGRSCRDNTVPSGVAPRSAQPDAGGGLAACRSHQFVPWELRPGSREDMAVIISPAVPRQSRRLPLASGLIPAGAGATMW
jgi:hypothetical protein